MLLRCLRVDDLEESPRDPRPQHSRCLQRVFGAEDLPDFRYYWEVIFMWVVYARRNCAWRGRLLGWSVAARWFYCRVVFIGKWTGDAPQRTNEPQMLNQECGVESTQFDTI